MEAATPLRAPTIRTLGEDRLVVDGLVIHDECAVRLVREREEAGDDPVKAVADAIEIGARVLDREQAGANADFVKSEFDKVSREVEAAFTDRAREVSEQLDKQIEAVFGAESGQLTKALERHFSDDSSAAVQNRMREVLAETTSKLREDLLKQFTAADGNNPLAEFKQGVQEKLREAGERQDLNLRSLNQQLGDLKVELQALRSEKEKLEELEEERERGAAKGRVFEEAVAEALEAIAAAQGDDCDAVGDLRGRHGQDRRRRGPHRRLPRSRARADRLRGEEPPPVEAGGDGGARPGARRARRRLRRDGRPERGEAARQDTRPARVQRRQAARRVGPGDRLARWRSRWPTRSPGRAC